MAGMEAQGSLNGRRCRSFRKDPPRINPVIPAAGGEDEVSVGLVNYVAQGTGYDTEECIRIALEDGVIELYHRNLPDYREYDTYRFTAKGAKMRDEHTWEIYGESIKARLRMEEEERKKKGDAWRPLGVPNGWPPQPVAEQLAPAP